MIKRRRVRTSDGIWIDVTADTDCLHGDGEHALLFARKLRQCFHQHQIQVRVA